MQKLIIPQKIKVGYQNREDTYTKKLAYVIYYDAKGVLRKEKSWESWRDKNITPDEYENVPTGGFVLNKKVGGYKSYWNFRSAYVRVYDPRGFEFEISVQNLIYILTQCDCSRGKGLEGKFVYSWDGTELVLLPVDCEDYKNSLDFTSLQTKKVSSKELIPGATYRTKQQQTLTYIGKFVKNEIQFFYSYEDNPEIKQPKKKYIFWDEKMFISFDDTKNIAELYSDTIHPNYSELVDKYNLSKSGSRPVELFTKPTTDENDFWAYEKEPGCYVVFKTHYKIIRWDEITKTYIKSSEIDYIKTNNKYKIINGVLIGTHQCQSISPNKDNSLYITPTFQTLWVRLESGAEIKL